jgi:hypothetical protein
MGPHSWNIWVLIHVPIPDHLSCEALLDSSFVQNSHGCYSIYVLASSLQVSIFLPHYWSLSLPLSMPPIPTTLCTIATPSSKISFPHIIWLFHIPQQFLLSYKYKPLWKAFRELHTDSHFTNSSWFLESVFCFTIIFIPFTLHFL